MRFYLHIRDGELLIEDPDGSEFDSLDEARREALASARDLLADRLRADKFLDGQKFEICNEAGELLDVVAFKEVLRLS